MQNPWEEDEDAPELDRHGEPFYPSDVADADDDEVGSADSSGESPAVLNGNRIARLLIAAVFVFLFVLWAQPGNPAALVIGILAGIVSQLRVSTKAGRTAK